MNIQILLAIGIYILIIIIGIVLGHKENQELENS
jgi:hypothetical protein